ncbi:MAG: FKBP-type peptidyl-prolyl cis-trans isomerase, partial [Bacteroidota bacterium]
MRAALLTLLLPLAACASGDPDAVAEPTSTVTVAYEGMLADGTVFDANDRATFSLRQVVPGFRSNITGMQVGETKTF